MLIHSLVDSRGSRTSKRLLAPKSLSLARSMVSPATRLEPDTLLIPPPLRRPRPRLAGIAVLISDASPSHCQSADDADELTDRDEKNSLFT